MPTSASSARSVPGLDQNSRCLRGRPVSGRATRAPSAPSGVRFIRNAALDAQSTMAVCMVVLVAGGHLGHMATVSAIPAQRRMPPADPCAGGRPPRYTHPDTPWTAPRTVRSVEPGPPVGPPPASLSPAPTAFHPQLTLAGISEPLATLAGTEALAVAEESGGAGSSLLWQGLAAWFADPCTHFDAYVNGFWKLAHPPGRNVPSRFAEQRAWLASLVRQGAARLDPQRSAAERVLAQVQASAAAAPDQQWQWVEADFERSRTLADRPAVARDICQAVLDARSRVLVLERIHDTGVLEITLPTLTEAEREVLALAPGDPALQAHKASLVSLLERSGSTPEQALREGDAVLAMEQALVAHPPQMRLLDLTQAQGLIPGFPWALLWTTLGLPARTVLYVDTTGCTILADLLATRAVPDWQAFLRCQDARAADTLLSTPQEPGTLLDTLDRMPAGALLLSAWYAGRADAASRQQADVMFEALRATFREEVARAPLPLADRTLLDAHLASVRLVHSDAGRTLDWSRVRVPDGIVAALRAVSAAGVRQALALIRRTAPMPDLEGHAHRLMMANDVTDGRVLISAGLLDALTAGASREQRWATLGMMLGHELGHSLHTAQGLTPQGAALFAQETAALSQRIGDQWSGGLHLNATLVADEAGCDLQGLRAALRGGTAEAEAAGEAFDARAFFTAAAALHASNPTQAQLRGQVARNEHPPGPFRAELVRNVQGFDAAFGCAPGPAAPYNHFFTQAGASPAAPNSG